MKKKSNKNNKLIYSIAAILGIVVVLLFGDHFTTENIENMFSNVVENQLAQNYESNENTTVVEGQNVVVHFFDVGQADSILVQSEEKTMLIDAGTNNMGKTVVKYLQDLNIFKIDYLVGTHPHEDHIGGLDDVINNFEIGTIYMPKVQTNTKTFEDVLDAISNKNLKITSPEVGFKFNVGNAQCEIMSIGRGTAEEKSNLNLSSIVIRMTYGEQSFLFTGDAEKQNEEARQWPQTTVLKVGHHGSDTSSSQEFLNEVKPQIAIISVGKGNTYGHPKQTTIDKLQKINARIYRTDESGTITITCDGKNNIVTTQK
mgnify:CR=1 FL=1